MRALEEKEKIYFIFILFIVNEKDFYDFISIDELEEEEKINMKQMPKKIFEEAIDDFKVNTFLRDDEEEKKAYKEKMISKYGEENGEIIFNLFTTKYE